MAKEYYEIGPSVNNIDFYIGGIIVSLYVSASLNVEPISVIKIAQASSNISLNCNLSSSANKIAYTDSNLSSSLNIDIIAIEELNVLLHAHLESQLSVSSSKIAYTSSNISISLSTSSIAKKITFGSTHIHNSLNITSESIAIRLGNNSPGFSSILNIVALGSEILNGQASIAILSRFLINPPIRFSPDYIDTSSIRTLLLLDGKPLTNHNRNLDISRNPIFIENRNWNNSARRYYKKQSSSDRVSFSLSWSFLPNFREKTVDNKMARDYLVNIAEDPDIHTLTIINQDENDLTPYTETTYNVFVRSYSESLIRRDLKDGVYYFDCSLTLEEA